MPSLMASCLHLEEQMFRHGWHWNQMLPRGCSQKLSEWMRCDHRSLNASFLLAQASTGPGNSNACFIAAKF